MKQNGAPKTAASKPFVASFGLRLRLAATTDDGEAS